MAAPSTVYSSNVLKVQQGSGTPAVLALLPLSLTEYGSDVNMKALFYLDEVKHCLDVSGKDVIQALVKDSGANYLMHAPARLGIGRYYKDGQNYILLNDGGLNTYGEVISFSAASNLLKNGITINAQFKAAYYASNNIAGIRFKVVNKTEYNSGQLIQIELKATATVNNRPYNVTDADDYYIQVGDIVEVTPFVQNDEGIKYGTTQSVTITQEPVEFKYGGTLAAAGTATTTQFNYVRNYDLAVGDTMYEPDGKNTAVNGYYVRVDDNKYFKVSGDKGVISEVGYYVAPVVPGYTIDWSAAVSGSVKTNCTFSATLSSTTDAATIPAQNVRFNFYKGTDSLYDYIDIPVDAMSVAVGGSTYTTADDIVEISLTGDAITKVTAVYNGTEKTIYTN